MGEFQDLTGKRLGAFRLVAKIGDGGFGAVYRAQPDVGLPRAVKIVRDSALVAALRREAEALFALRHPRIVELLHADLSADPPHLVMELISGGSLAGRLPLERASWLPTTKMIVEGLAHAHARGVAHLDLKPSNILVDSSGPKISDFGLARAVASGISQSLPSASGSGGTIAYMSPEQREGRRGDTRSDMFSLAILICEILTGKRPQAAETLDDLLGSEAPSWARVLFERGYCRYETRFADAGEALLVLEEHLKRRELAQPNPLVHTPAAVSLELALEPGRTVPRPTPPILLSVEFAYFIYTSPKWPFALLSDEATSSDEWKAHLLRSVSAGYDLRAVANVVTHVDGNEVPTPERFSEALAAKNVIFCAGLQMYVSDFRRHAYSAAHKLRERSGEMPHVVHFASVLGFNGADPAGGGERPWYANMLAEGCSSLTLVFPDYQRKFGTLDELVMNERMLASLPDNHATIRAFWFSEWPGLEEVEFPRMVFVARCGNLVGPWLDPIFDAFVRDSQPVELRIIAESPDGSPASRGWGDEMEPDAALRVSEPRARVEAWDPHGILVRDRGRIVSIRQSHERGHPD